MCNRYGYLAPITRLVDEFSQTRIPLRFKEGAIPNIEPREHIRPTDTAPIIRPLDRAEPFLCLIDPRRLGVASWRVGAWPHWSPSPIAGEGGHAEA